MTHSSIQWYPLSPAQPTNEASPWLIAQSSDIHSVLLSDIYPLHPAQPVRPVHYSMPSPMIYPSVLLSHQVSPVGPLLNPQWSTIHSVQLSQQVIGPVYTDDPISGLVLSGMETTSANLLHEQLLIGVAQSLSVNSPLIWCKLQTALTCLSLQWLSSRFSPWNFQYPHQHSVFVFR